MVVSGRVYVRDSARSRGSSRQFEQAISSRGTGGCFENCEARKPPETNRRKCPRPRPVMPFLFCCERIRACARPRLRAHTCAFSNTHECNFDRESFSFSFVSAHVTTSLPSKSFVRVLLHDIFFSRQKCMRNKQTNKQTNKRMLKQVPRTAACNCCLLQGRQWQQQQQ